MVSTLSGPIPPHPYYDKGDVKAYLNLPAPRVRPEAEDIANHAHGSVGMVLQIEGHRPPSVTSKAKAPPPDHLKGNVQRLRQIQKAARQRNDESNKPVKALWKSTKYEGVQSKVREKLESASERERPHSASYLRAHSRTGWAQANQGTQSAREPSSAEDRMSVSRASTARDVKLIRRDVDFIKLNGNAVKHVPMVRSPSLTALDELKKKAEDEEHNYKRGRVPKYLQKRQKEWQEQEEDRVASIPDPEMPPGHRRMDDTERKATLTKLQQTQTELLQQLGHMPIRNDTVRIRRKKEEIEAKLAEIEEAIKIFSRSKVFVKLDT